MKIYLIGLKHMKKQVTKPVFYYSKIQFFNILISNNFRRLITGILGGIGIISIIYFIIIQITEIF